ncbi:uncharacterized protein E0L32_004649 [Thyridium curvatum]|uniref:Uncharacterized protein n=1 Tax=Thyridium curvatum TaxID=1093900 RepID=A0A507AZF7_9PEZI|nr:uncharacterized protein E0L32_004649 [Thyridium curvatum]TPX15372.1 hypothetical protein E0L32_004649 [Thyridium curvatum]
MFNIHTRRLAGWEFWGSCYDVMPLSEPELDPTAYQYADDRMMDRPLHENYGRMRVDSVGDIESMLRELAFDDDSIAAGDLSDTSLQIDTDRETALVSIVTMPEPMDVDKDTAEEEDTCMQEHEEDTCMQEHMDGDLLLHRRVDFKKSKASRRMVPITTSAKKRHLAQGHDRKPESGFTQLGRLATVSRLSNRLLGRDPISTFAGNCEDLLPRWIALLRETTFPGDITSTDSRIPRAFRAVDSILCGQDRPLLQRLASVQLARLFQTVKDIIKSDRHHRRIDRVPYSRDANLAMNIYMSAQETQSNARSLRIKLEQSRKRFSKRWSLLAVSSPLFVLVYTDAAEAVVRDFKKVDNSTLAMVAARISKTCPHRLVGVCAGISRAAEVAATSGNWVDPLSFSSERIRQCLLL